MDTNQELAEFLRSRRNRLTDAAGGIAQHRRRRTPGLRREDVAQRAGISIEWYVKLEQGRAVSPSDATLNALSEALELNAAERAHLQRLVGKAKRTRFCREVVPPTIKTLLESLPQPAYVTGQRWDILAWNPAAANLFGDFADIPVEDRNILLFVLADPKGRKLFGSGWANEARRMVALFRAEHDLWNGDSAFAKLVERLHAGCAEFDGWWRSHDIAAPVGGSKLLHHPVRGDVKFGYATFQANDDPRLKLALYFES